MNLATIVGIVGAFGMVIFTAINTAGGIIGLIRLLNLPSFALVVMGSYFSVMTSTKMDGALAMFGIIKKTFGTPTFNPGGLIAKLMAMSEKARREGLLALEEELEDLDDEFIKKGMRLVVDGTDGAIIKNLMELEISEMQNRHADKISLLSAWAGMAPGYGMMGTVIGLVNMLANLADTSSIGTNMAMALITTLYGSLLANATLTPWAVKLQNYDAQETAIKEMGIEGILSIQSGDNPRILGMKLLAYVDPVTRKSIETEIIKD